MEEKGDGKRETGGRCSCSKRRDVLLCAQAGAAAWHAGEEEEWDVAGGVTAS